MDQSYIEALEAAPEPHRPLLGPVPCSRCGAWLEWAGVRWLNAGTQGAHECAAFLQLPEDDAPGGAIVASWVRPTTGLRYQQAHPAAPAWVDRLGAGILWVAALLAAAFALALVARYLGI